MTGSILCGVFKRTDGRRKQHKYVATFENAEPPLVPGLESLRSQDFIHFKSRKLIYNQLLEALERNYMTGLHGERGVGKATLAKQVGLKLHESMKFDVVIFITVSKCSNIKEIQDIIADKLGLSLEGNNEWERTDTIMKRLMNVKRFLIILDDVREYINTEELGIPSTPYNMNCRVLVTSREKEVCMSIGCVRSIQLQMLLRREEVLMLFKKHVGINDNSSQEMQRLAKYVCYICQELSTIMGIASILKGRPLEIWKMTIHKFYDVYTNVNNELNAYDECWIKCYVFLNFSHDDLNIEKARRLSILVSLFPLKTEVPIEMFIRLGIGVGLFGEVEKYSEARKEILKLKDILVDSHVCFFADEGGHIKINDIFWQMIQYDLLSIIENNIHYLYHLQLRAEDMEFDLIPSWYRFDGTKVEMLLINVEASNHVEVPNAFFEKMARLQVLSLSSNKFHPTLSLKLPSSLQSLTNIRSLLLSHWKLCDISILGKLQSLDTLDFDDCSINEFPKEISKLKLRLLSLKRCKIERNNPFEVIERCLSLQELYYKDNEVSNLHSVNEAEEIYQSGTFPGLNRYHLQGGEDDSISKCVCIPSFDALVSEATFKYLIQGAEILHLKEIRKEWRNLIPEIVLSMNDVVELCVESCLHLQGTLFKSKVNLCNLKSVNLFDCPELTSLFQLSTAQSLVLLEELRIRECKLLTNIIEDENDPKSNGLIFPKLEIVEIEGCSNLFNISIECCPLFAPRVKRSSPRIGFKAKQQDASKDRRHKLRSASRQIEGPMSSISSSECPPKQSPGLNILIVHNIKQLVLKYLDKIKYLFTLSTASSMMLEILIVDSCDLLKHIIDIGDGCDAKKFDVFRELKRALSV